MFDDYHDKRLGVETGGLREWLDEPEYHRTESTPYRALEELAKFFPLEAHRKVLDFGCGRGRVSFFFHDKFGVNVTGLELQMDTYNELRVNEENYLEKKGLDTSPFNFIWTSVEDHMPLQEDVFYFFNPFSLGIFKHVLGNIEESLTWNDREAFIIMYYAFPEYIDFLDKKTRFKRVLRVPLAWEDDEQEMFYIYQYLPGLD